MLPTATEDQWKLGDQENQAARGSEGWVLSPLLVLGLHWRLEDKGEGTWALEPEVWPESPFAAPQLYPIL